MSGRTAKLATRGIGRENGTSQTAHLRKAIDQVKDALEHRARRLRSAPLVIELPRPPRHTNAAGELEAGERLSVRNVNFMYHEGRDMPRWASDKLHREVPAVEFAVALVDHVYSVASAVDAVVEQWLEEWDAQLAGLEEFEGDDEQKSLEVVDDGGSQDPAGPYGEWEDV